MNDIKLIFLISLPRSGSTLLQHILGNHSEIAASAEPWILFPHLLALRTKSFYAKYQPEIGRIALTDYLEQLTGNDQVYFDGIRKYGDHMYNAFVLNSGKKYFLDKTSRYYIALPELYRTYPDAKYIFLLRNPLSIFASFVENMIDGDIRRLGSDGIRDDLLDGYKILIKEKMSFDESIDKYFIKYEDLIFDPQAEVNKICQFIGVKYEPEMINYMGTKNVLKGKLIDPKSIHKHDKPVVEYLNSWKRILNNKERLNLAYNYINYLGQDLIENAGYQFNELIDNCYDLGSIESSSKQFNKIMMKKNGFSLPRNTGIVEAWRNRTIGLLIYRIYKAFVGDKRL